MVAGEQHVDGGLRNVVELKEDGFPHLCRFDAWAGDHHRRGSETILLFHHGGCALNYAVRHERKLFGSEENDIGEHTFSI